VFLSNIRAPFIFLDEEQFVWRAKSKAVKSKHFIFMVSGILVLTKSNIFNSCRSSFSNEFHRTGRKIDISTLLSLNN